MSKLPSLYMSRRTLVEITRWYFTCFKHPFIFFSAHYNCFRQCYFTIFTPLSFSFGYISRFQNILVGYIPFRSARLNTFSPSFDFSVDEKDAVCSQTKLVWWMFPLFLQAFLPFIFHAPTVGYGRQCNVLALQTDIYIDFHRNYFLSLCCPIYRTSSVLLKYSLF